MAYLCPKVCSVNGCALKLGYSHSTCVCIHVACQYAVLTTKMGISLCVCVCVCVCMYVCTYAGKAVMYIASCVVFSFWLITQLPSTSTDSLGRSKSIHVCGCVTQVEQCSYCLLCRSSALPVIQRGCYTHLIGHRKGQPLEINYIKKGSVIHFRSSDHPGLPSSLRIRPMVALMITNVDEKAKKQLL